MDKVAREAAYVSLKDCGGLSERGEAAEATGSSPGMHTASTSPETLSEQGQGQSEQEESEDEEPPEPESGFAVRKGVTVSQPAWPCVSGEF